MNRNDRLNCRLDRSVNIDPYRLGVKMMIMSRFRNWKRTQYLLGVDGLIAPQPDEARPVQGL
jgi:hypothetical protein